MERKDTHSHCSTCAGAGLEGLLSFPKAGPMSKHLELSPPTQPRNGPTFLCAQSSPLLYSLVQSACPWQFPQGQLLLGAEWMS